MGPDPQALAAGWGRAPLSARICQGVLRVNCFTVTAPPVAWVA